MDARLRPYLTFDYDNFPWCNEQGMKANINSGKQLTRREEMTQEYFDELVWLLVAQMDSEYVGAYGYVPLQELAIRFDPDETRHVPQMVRDEFMHGDRINDVLNLLGFDARKWKTDHERGYSFRLPIDSSLHVAEELNGGRLTDDFRVNIFYYPIVVPNSSTYQQDLLSWINFTIFQFLQDRGAGEQLRDTLTSSFLPWAKENTKTMREENRHIRHGDIWMMELFRQFPDLTQKQFDLWWPRSLATFGRPQSKRNDLWRKLGLKHRTNIEVVCAFLGRGEEPVGIYRANEEVGLKIPSLEETLEFWRDGSFLNTI
jgi:ring-1,2-phenylacetyl-CoA epoxidase subunit PaaA